MCLIEAAKAALECADKPPKHPVPDLKNRRVVLCGFSPYARHLADALLEEGAETSLISIVDTEKTADEYRGIKILPYDMIREDALCVICSNPYAGFYAEYLAKRNAEHVISYHLLSLDNVRYDSSSERYNSKVVRERIRYLLENKPFYSDLLDKLADGESRAILAKWILYHMTMDAKYLNAKSITPPYFGQAVIPETAYRVFWDFGGFDGDTLRDFLSLGVDFDEYRYFEPDADLFQRGTNSSSDSRVKYHNLAVGRFTGTANYAKTGSTTGRLDAAGATCVTVETIDHLADTYTEAPSCIKMDIEGGEYDALLGARDTIRRFRPALMVSVEHKPEDIKVLVETIRSFCADYKFYMRCCTDSIFTDLTLFAAVE